MDIVVRASVMFAVIYALLRMLGKRELGQMTPFELISLIVIGDLIQQGVTQDDHSLTGAVLAVATFSFWALVLSWISYLWPRGERLLEGEPRVLIKNGELLRQNLKRDRMTSSEIESEMRLAGIASMKEVAWAMLEPNGKISFIRKVDISQGDRPASNQRARD